MTTSPETPQNTPSGAPAKALEDTLLKNFRATLEQRWNEFDIATMQEANSKAPFGAKYFRDNDADFMNAKNAFDQAKAMLSSINNDAELKANTQVLVTVESTLKALTDHLKQMKPEEKNKAINIILAKTTADLSRFKADITGKEEDKKQAEVAIAAEKAIPRAALAATTTAGGLSLMSSAEAKDLAKEGTNEVKKGIKGWIAEELGFDKKTMIEDMAKKAKGESIGFGATIRLMIFSFLNRFEFLGMTDDWTPEELKLAGFKGPVVSQNPEPQKEQVELKNDNLKYVASVEMLLKFGQSREERAENVLGIAGQMLKEPKFNSLSIASLRKGFNANTKKFDVSLLGENEKTIISSLPIDSKQKENALHLIARLFFDTSNSIQSQVSASLLKSGDAVSIRSGILNGSKNLRKFTPFGSIDLSNPQAMLQEGAGKYIPSIDPTTHELTGELAEDFNSSMGKKNALWIFGYAKDQQVPLDEKSIATHFQTENPDLSKDPEDQEKLKKILQFGVDIRRTITNDATINLGKGNEVTKAVEKVFTLGDLGILYTFLDGKTNPADMNSLEKGFLIMKVADMVQISDKELFGYYSTSIVDALLGLASPIDPKVKKVFSDMLGYATDKAGNVISDTAQVIWGSANKNPVVAIGLLATILFAPWFSKRTSIIGPLRR